MSGFNGIDPQTAAGLSTLAAVVTQWEPTLKNQNLAKALRLASTRMAELEEVTAAALDEYEKESWTEDTQSARDVVVHGKKETPA